MNEYLSACHEFLESDAPTVFEIEFTKDGSTNLPSFGFRVTIFHFCNKICVLQSCVCSNSEQNGGKLHEMSNMAKEASKRSESVENAPMRLVCSNIKFAKRPRMFFFSDNGKKI